MSLIPIGKAAELLSVRRATLRQVLNERKIKIVDDPLDKRVKLVERADVLKLRVREKVV